VSELEFTGCHRSGTIKLLQSIEDVRGWRSAQQPEGRSCRRGGGGGEKVTMEAPCASLMKVS
jgi:hypothetical protein